MDAEGLQEIWVLIGLCCFFTPVFGLIFWGFAAAVEEEACDRNGRCSETCSACTACLGIVAL
eukprot:COSAG02_NODE_10225_length_1991_cov_2.938278_2_plen_61_part_01